MPIENLLTLDEVADKLGVNLRQVKYIIQKGELPYVKVTARNRKIREQDLNTFINNHIFKVVQTP